MPIRFKPTPSPTGTANRVAIFDPVSGALTESTVTDTELQLLAGLSGDILTTTNAKTVSSKTFAQDIVFDANNTRDIGSNAVKAKDAYLQGQLNAGTISTTGNVIVGGDLTVNGTTVTANVSTIEVEDPNILLNNGGNDATSEGAGLTIERTGTNGSLIYADASATKFRAGPAGTEVDLVGTSSTQTLTNKTIVAANNTITTAASGNLVATNLNAALAELDGDITTVSNSVAGKWSKAGDSGTTAGTDFVGTTDAQDLVIKRNSTEIARAQANGWQTSTLVGSSSSGANLTVRSTSNATPGDIIIGDRTGEQTIVGPTGSTTTYNYSTHVLATNANSLANALVIQDNSSNVPITITSAGPQSFIFAPKDAGGTSTIVTRVSGGDSGQWYVVRASDGTLLGTMNYGLAWGITNNNTGIVAFRVSGSTGQTADLQQWSNVNSYGATVSSVGSGGQFRGPAGTVSLPGFAFQGDTNNGWWAPAADTQAWSLAGAEAMRLNSTGLGIGKTATVKLDVAGSIATDTSLILEDPGAGTNKITIQAPTLAGDHTITLPTANSSGFMKNNGSGTLSYSSTVNAATELTGIVPSANGGTGVNNAGSLTYGSNNITITTSGATSLTVPTSGTVATLAGTEQLTNKDIDGGTASNTSRITIPKAAKATLDALTRKEATVVYASDEDKLYYDDGSTLRAVGSGAGGSGSGINLLTLDSAYTAGAEPNNFDFEDAAEGVGTWAAYADAAGTAPVDMTGGSPGSTLARDTTSEINGAASLKFDLGSGSSRQGEGFSNLTYIPPAYRGRTLEFKFPYAISGTILENDLTVYAYDVTNSALITPVTFSKLLGSSGICIAHIAVPSSCAQLRVGVHVSRTSTAALSIIVDDMQLSPFTVPVGLSGSNWQSDLDFTLSAGFGTTSGKQIWYRREGDSMRVRGNFTWGTGAASTVYIQMPSGYTIDTAKMPTTTDGTFVGKAHLNDAGNQIESSGVGLALFYDGSTNNQIFVCRASGTTSTYSKQNGNAFSSSNKQSFEFLVPISGWSSNVSMGESSSFLISSYLANGTRVTGSAPARLGEYRSYLRNAGARTFTETNGSPSATPSSSNGLALYRGNGFASADTNNNPTKYEIFVGKNKVVAPIFYSSTGRTGGLDATSLLNGTDLIGYAFSYDPITGIASLYQNLAYGSYAQHFTGVNQTDGNVNSGTTYFDVLVSENALSVSSQQPRSEIIVHSGNGHGSTATKIRRFTTTAKSIGTAITYADSSTNGATFTINEDGVYSISYGDQYSAASERIGITVNDTATTTNIGTPLTYAQGYRQSALAPAAAAQGLVTWTGVLSAGDVVRAHTNGNADATNNNCLFSIVKVSN